MKFAIATLFLLAGESAAQWLLPTITTVSGSKKPDFIFPGQLVFEDKFDYFDDTTWQYEKLRDALLIYSISTLTLPIIFRSFT